MESDELDPSVEDSTEGPVGVFHNGSRASKFLDMWDRDVPPEKRNYGVKVCLAGAEGQGFRDGLFRVGIRHILVSYYYFRSWLKKRTVQEIQDDLGRFDFVILDSGGFTLMQDAKKKGGSSSMKAYAEEYYAEVRRIGHLFSVCAEVDVPTAVGMDYSEQIKRELISEGLPIMPVMQGAPIKRYEDLGWFENYPYIAIGSSVLESVKYRGWLGEAFRKAEMHGFLLHGFGATTNDILNKKPFYSVDSTTWLDGGKFGTTIIFENGRLRYYDLAHKDVRKRYKKRFEENCLVFADIQDDKPLEVNLMNAVAWRQLSEHLRYDIKKAYWLNDDEKSSATETRSRVLDADGLIDRDKSLARTLERRGITVRDANIDDRIHEPLQCDLCSLSGRCPRYVPKDSCGYDFNLKLDTERDVHTALKVIIEAEYGRVMTGVLFEKMEGGVLDKNLSQEMKNLVDLIQKCREIFIPGKALEEGEDEVSIRAKGTGAVGQMLAAVLGSKDSESKEEVEIIDVTPRRSD